MKELIVPLVIIGILASLILPLPAGIIDFMLVANVICALVLLISTLYISNPIKLSSLPSILLLTTLYRLALNISTTRLILGSGEGGSLIQAFGSIVIQDSLVVGAVVFLIITLVQFIVIAKGSERVAEVSARFTLDALPGKQMSIDADVRSGLIDFEEARAKRQELQIESRFYGALDGAMKFVKGDAIAGLVITIINVLGGFAIGIFVNGLEIQTAVSKYTLLTVGDGLLSQIPALLNSLAAGMVVTRVAREDGASLAEELLAQLGQVRRVKILVGVLAVVLAFVPAMPILPFLSLATVLFISAALSAPDKEDSLVTEEAEDRFHPKTPAVLQVIFRSELRADLLQQGRLLEETNTFLQKVFNKQGLIILPPQVSFSDDLDKEYQILMRGVVVTKSDSSSDLLANVFEELEKLVFQRADEFVDDILTRRTLDFFDAQAPELVTTVVPGIVTVTQLSVVLKDLVHEEISIRNFDLILQAVAEHGAKANGARVLLEEVRVALRRVICSQHAEDGEIKGYTLEPVIDLAFVRSEREAEAFNLDHIASMVQCLSEANYDNSVLIVSKGARKLIKECLEIREIPIAVLAQEELVNEVNFRSLARIESFQTNEREGLVAEMGV